MSKTGTFLNKFAADRNFSIPLPFQWTVTIDDDNLPAVITNAVGKINQSWKVASSSAWTDKLSDNILVAQEIQIPSESVEITSISQENRGAFMPGYGVTQRTDFLSRNVTINFLETEKDIETELFRPWIIALSVDGLLNQNLKSIITMKQYTRDGGVRKIYKFTGVYPTNTEGYTLNYGDQELLIKTVTFGYTNYTVEVPEIFVPIPRNNNRPVTLTEVPIPRNNNRPVTPTEVPIPINNNRPVTPTEPQPQQVINRTQVTQQYLVRQGQFTDLAGNPLTGERLAAAQATQARVDAARQRANNFFRNNPAVN